MKRIFVVFLMLILVTVSACKKNSIIGEQALLDDIFKKMYEAFQKGDIEYPKKYNSKEMELVVTSKEFKGILSFSEWLKDFDTQFKPAGNVKITVNNVRWITTPTMAISKSEEIWELNIHTNPQKNNYFTTIVYEKLKNQWYVVHVHQSEMP